jgi:hypothetical protein
MAFCWFLLFYLLYKLLYSLRLKDGRAFKNKRMTYENRVAKYVINETTENSAGLYTCQARNDAGSAETSCQLNIQGTY